VVVVMIETCAVGAGVIHLLLLHQLHLPIPQRPWMILKWPELCVIHLQILLSARDHELLPTCTCTATTTPSLTSPVCGIIHTLPTPFRDNARQNYSEPVACDPVTRVTLLLPAGATMPGS